MNSSANISIYNTPGSGMVNLGIHRGGVKCDETTTPSCYAFTSLRAATVIFNVSYWSKYNISGGIPQCSPTTNQDWLVDYAEICAAQNVDIDAGKIIIGPGGSLSLTNTADYHKNLFKM